MEATHYSENRVRTEEEKNNELKHYKKKKFFRYAAMMAMEAMIGIQQDAIFFVQTLRITD